MAARRLIIAMIALLLLSTLAAAFLPAPDATDTSTTSTTRERPQRPPAPAGRLIHAAVDAGARRPQAISMREGDELLLRVRSRASDQGEGVGFGARFDLLATRAGSFPVRLVDAHRTVARIQVSPRDRPSTKRPGAKARGG